MTRMIDPHQPDKDLAKRSTIAKEKEAADDIAYQMFHGNTSTYEGSKAALNRLKGRRQ